MCQDTVEFFTIRRGKAFAKKVAKAKIRSRRNSGDPDVQWQYDCMKSGLKHPRWFTIPIFQLALHKQRL